MSTCLKKKLKALYLMGAEYFNFECVEGLNANVNNGRCLLSHGSNFTTYFPSKSFFTQLIFLQRIFVRGHHEGWLIRQPLLTVCETKRDE